MTFDYDLKSNLVAMISNHSQSQSKLQLDKQIGLLCAGPDIYKNVNSRRNYVSKHDVSKSVCPKITNGRHLAENAIEYGDVFRTS